MALLARFSDWFYPNFTFKLKPKPTNNTLSSEIVSAPDMADVLNSLNTQYKNPVFEDYVVDTPKDDEPEPAEETEDEKEKEYEVEDIIGEKTVEGVKYYKIKWTGYSKEWNTWEPEENLNVDESFIEECRQRRRDGLMKKCAKMRTPEAARRFKKSLKSPLVKQTPRRQIRRSA